MIMKEFEFKNKKHFIAINQIQIKLDEFLNYHNLNNEENAINNILEFINYTQNEYNSVIQFLDDSYILNEDHIFKAWYFVEKAFHHKINISNKKNIELLLYLTSKRQIKKGIEAFGIKIANLKAENITFFISSYKDNLNEINQEVIQYLKSNTQNLKIKSKTIEKFESVKNFYGITESQIKCVLNSYGLKEFKKNKLSDNLNSLYSCLLDLIYEKMALLSLEKIKIN